MTPKEQPKHGETWMCLILSSGEHREMEYLGDVEWVGRDKDGEVYACHTEHLDYMWRKV